MLVNDFEIIDFHTHPIKEGWQNIGYYRDIAHLDKDSFYKTLKDMNVSKFCGAVITSEPLKEGEDEWGKIKKLNESALWLREYYKGDFIPGFHIHPNYLEESIKEIDKMHQLKVNLVGELVPYLQGYSNMTTSKAFDDLLDYCAQKNMVVSLHRDTGIETILSRHPNCKIVLAHPGDGDALKACIEWVKKSKNFYVDIAGWGIIRYGNTYKLVKELGADRIIYGSDFPTCSPQAHLYTILCDGYLTKEQKQLILSQNAKRLLNID